MEEMSRRPKEDLHPMLPHQLRLPPGGQKEKGRAGPRVVSQRPRSAIHLKELAKQIQKGVQEQT